jgi:23S rRNA (cytosine1962-C5)-methyltransferase
MNLTGIQSEDYEYLDAGAGARLERYGAYILNRPSPQAIWSPERPELWKQAAGIYHRSSSGGGEWEFTTKLPESWPVKYGPCTFTIKPTGFGHTGLFPEHSCHWDWVRAQIRAAGEPCRILHLFAYTGAMSLVAAEAGAQVCHVDAVEDINRWARRNAEASGLAAKPVRWITDDALKFTAREVRRKRTYEGVILDPPTYGKGPDNERWFLEDQIAILLEHLHALMAEKPRFILFTCHTPGFSTPLLENLLRAWPASFGGRLESGNMTMTNRDCRCVLPVGVFVRWQAEEGNRTE